MAKAKAAKVKHIGFSGAQKKVEGEGYTKQQAGAIVASASRGASKSAKKANPNLKKVVSKKKK